MNAAVECGDNIALDSLAVNGHALNARAYMVRVLNGDIVGRAAEQTGNGEAVPLVRNGGIDHQTVVLRLYAEDILRDGNEVPCRRTCKPAVLCLAVTLCVLACDHLSVNIRLGAVQVGSVLTESGSDLAVIFERLVAVTYRRLCADDPRVVVAEYARVLLVAAGVSGDLAVFDLVGRECGVVEHKTVLAVEVLVNAFESLDVVALVLAKSRKNAPALRLDEDLALLALVRANLVAVVVVSAEEPLAVVAVFLGLLSASALSPLSSHILTNSGAIAQNIPAIITDSAVWL